MDMQNEETPEFPLPAYRNLSQILSLPLEEGQSAEDVVAKTARVLTVRGASDKPSSRVTFKREVNYGWESRSYPGQLLAIHGNGSLLAYAMAERQTNNWAVRVMNNKDSTRILIKGIKGAVQDVSFAYPSHRIMLAIVTEFADLHVYEIINEPRPNLSYTALLHITHSKVADGNSDNPLLSHRIIWQPVVPNYDEEVDAATLALLVGSKVEIWRVEHLSELYGANEVDASEIVAGGLTTIDAHKDIVTNGVFSQEGTAFASCSLDGSMIFCRLYLDEPPKVLRNWKPHDNAGLTHFCFLENMVNPTGEVWRYLITAANNNKDIKLWDCKEWSLIQTVTLVIEGHPKLCLDASASILMASDQTSLTIYLFKVSTEPVACIEAVSAYLLPFTVLSFCIESVTGFGFGLGLNGDEDDSDLSDVEDGAVPSVEPVVNLYVISPQSLQSGRLHYLRPTEGKQLPLSTLAPDVPELPPPPFTLMTPKELTSPGQLPTEVDVTPTVKTEPVEAVVSGASSPSMEVSEILSQKDVDLLAKEPVERVAIKQETESPSNANNWPAVTSSTPTRRKRTRGKEKKLRDKIFINGLKKQTIPNGDSVITRMSESLGKTQTTNEDIMGTPVVENKENAELMKKVDAILAFVQKQDAQIKDLEAKLRKPDETLRILEAHGRRVQDDVKSALEAHTKLFQHSQQTRRDAAVKDDRQYYLNMLSQIVENHLSMKLTEVIQSEIRSTVLPVIVSELEPFKRKLHSEMTQQLSATDHLLKENISKLVQSKPVMEVLANSVTQSLRKTLGDTCKEIVTTHMINKLEKSLEKSFYQVNDTFSKGIREWSTTIQKESHKVQEEMKRAEQTMLQVATTNETATIALNNQTATMEKSFNSLCGALTAQVTEAMLKAAAVAPSPGGGVARALTPAVQTIERQNCIAQYLRSGQHNLAFKEALSASDLSVLMFACEKVAVEQLFSVSPCPLSQPVLLSLIQQLTADLSHNTGLKTRYLSEAIYQLEPDDPTTKEHLRSVFGTVEKHINGFLGKLPGSANDVKAAKDLNRVLKYFKMLVGK